MRTPLNDRAPVSSSKEPRASARAAAPCKACRGVAHDDTGEPPAISVLMAVRDGGAFLRPAIESILSQTCRSLEFVIVDDASHDETPEILAGCARRDSRISVLRNDANLGLARSLNRGLQAARGGYVARQDADDVSLPHRLETQRRFLDAHAEVGLLGSAYTVIDEAGRPGETCSLPPTDTGIRWRMLFHNAFCHSAVMFRRNLLDAALPGYDPDLSCAQDYDLWSRLLLRTRAANLAEPLLLYRRHSDSVTSRRRAEQDRVSEQVSAERLAALGAGGMLSSDEVRRLRAWTAGFPRLLQAEDLPLCRTFLAILAAFERQDGLDGEVVGRIRACWRGRVQAALPPEWWQELMVAPREAAHA